MTPTPADPGAIDLAAYEQYCRSVEDHSQGPFITLKIREVRALIAAALRAREALAFAASCIKSGEPWTDQCQEEIGSLLMAPKEKE